MTWTLHGARGCGSLIAEAACAELGVEVRIRDWDARAGEHQDERYGALNPQHKFPTLESDDGELLIESLAIVLTLDERHPGKLLPPPASRARARALPWLVFMATELYSIIEFIDFPERLAGDPAEGQGVTIVRDNAKAIWRRRWQLLESRAAASPYFLAEGFSAIDLYIALLSRWDLDPQWRSEQLPRVEAITEAVRERPAVAAVWSRHFGGG